MIPLVRPVLPSLAEVGDYFQESIAAGQFSNFGPCWQHAAEKIEKLTGMLALPCANGTVAVALALYGKLMKRGRWAQHDKFTFVATLRAIESINGAPAPPGEKDKAKAITYPFGYAVRAPAGCVVIDAAGGFHADIGKANDGLPSKAAIAVSFHATKWLPIGEGGAALFDQSDKEAYQRARRAMNFGFNAERIVVEPWGINGKLDELHSAALCAQLDRIETFMRRATECENAALEWCNKIEEFDPPDFLMAFMPSAPSMVTVVAKHAGELVANLNAQGTMAQRGYWPTLGELGPEDYRNSVVCLPRDVTTRERGEIEDQIKNFYKG